VTVCDCCGARIEDARGAKVMVPPADVPADVAPSPEMFATTMLDVCAHCIAPLLATAKRRSETLVS
jgi:hypothetical protein